VQTRSPGGRAPRTHQALVGHSSSTSAPTLTAPPRAGVPRDLQYPLIGYPDIQYISGYPISGDASGYASWGRGPGGGVAVAGLILGVPERPRLAPGMLARNRIAPQLLAERAYVLQRGEPGLCHLPSWAKSSFAGHRSILFGPRHCPIGVQVGPTRSCGF
jgi:hypothetical protein